MLSAVHDRIVYRLKYLKRVLCVVIGPHDRRIEAGTISGVAGSSDLFDFSKQCIFVAVDGK